MRKLLPILLFLSAPSWGVVAHVQSNANGAISVPNPCVVSYPGNVTAGNFLVGYCYSANVGATLAATDSLGQAWNEAQSQSQATDGNVFKIVYATNTAGGANTLTCSWTGGASTYRCGVSEYSGVALTSPLDQHTSASGAGTAANSGNVTPTQDNELIIQAAGDSSAGTFTIGTGTKRVNVPDATNTRIAGGEEIQTTATTRQAAWTLGASGNWTSLIATFKAAGGVAATPVCSPILGSALVCGGGM